MTFTAMSLGMWTTLFASIGGVVTLLYMLRLRRRRVEVPFGPLWQKVLSEKQTTSLFRVLKRIWSLLLQLIFVAAILTAIADPQWTGDGKVEYREPREPEPSHTLLVIDTSASMAAVDVDGGRMGRAVAAAHKIIDRRQLGERLMVARMDRDVEALTDWTEDTGRLHGAVGELRALDTGTDPTPLVQFARNAVRGLPNAQVVLVTDQAFAPVDAELAAAIKLRVVSVGGNDPTNNLAVLDFNVRSHFGNALKYAIYYKIKNFSDQPVKAAVYIYGDPQGEATERAQFTRGAPLMTPMVHQLGPGEEKVVEKVGVDLVGNRAMLMVEPYEVAAGYTDVMPADDVAYAVVPQRKSVKVLMVGEANFFLMAGLQTRSFVKVDTVSRKAYSTSKGYDLTVFDGQAPAKHDAAAAFYVNAVGEGVPYTLRKKGKARQGGALKVASKQRRHPIMRFVKFVEFEAAELLPLRKRRGDKVLATTRGGRPAIIAHAGADSRWIAVGFDPVADEWIGHFSYPIFMVNAINWFFSEEVKLLRPWSLAERWGVRIPWKGIESVEITLPGGRTETALVDAGGTLAYTGRREGIYEIRHPDPEQAKAEPPLQIAAALRSEAESILDSRGEYTEWEPPEVQKRETSKLQILGADLWQLLIMFALLLMAIEWFSYHRRWTV